MAITTYCLSTCLSNLTLSEVAWEKLKKKVTKGMLYYKPQLNVFLMFDCLFVCFFVLFVSLFVCIQPYISGIRWNALYV